MNNRDQWLRDVSNKELASTSSIWIQRAVQQKNDRLTVGLAYSILLTYSDLDKVLLQRQTLN